MVSTKLSTSIQLILPPLDFCAVRNLWAIDLGPYELGHPFEMYKLFLQLLSNGLMKKTGGSTLVGFS